MGGSEHKQATISTGINGMALTINALQRVHGYIFIYSVEIIPFLMQHQLHITGHNPLLKRI